jgi:hypothetical protein
MPDPGACPGLDPGFAGVTGVDFFKGLKGLHRDTEF